LLFVRLVILPIAPAAFRDCQQRWHALLCSCRISCMHNGKKDPDMQQHHFHWAPQCTVGPC
jgi:hypothetical protein